MMRLLKNTSCSALVPRKDAQPAAKDYLCPVEFNSSQRSTIGVEVEYGIVSRQTGDLVTCASEILAELNTPTGRSEHPKVKNELLECTIEVITGICENPAEAKADIAATLHELEPILTARNLGLASSGTHPFGRWEEMRVTPSPRYQRMVEELQWPAIRLLIHGVHVHVGVRSAEKAVITTNVLAGHLPLVLALSCSSPYWRGEDTGLASSRTKIFEGLPTTGIPPQLASWDAYNRLLDALVKAGTIKTMREIWWDVRPHPNFGTVELRMADGIATLDETMAIAAIAQCLVTHIDEVTDAGGSFELLPDWVLRENKWRACRYGLDAELIIDDLGNTQPLREQLSEVVAMLTPLADRLGCLDELNHALTIAANEASYQRQRRVLSEGGTLADVVALLVAEHDQSLAEALAQK